MPDIEGCPHCRCAGFYTETCDIYPSQVYCSCVAGKALKLAESNTLGGHFMLNDPRPTAWKRILDDG